MQLRGVNSVRETLVSNSYYVLNFCNIGNVVEAWVGRCAVLILHFVVRDK